MENGDDKEDKTYYRPYPLSPSLFQKDITSCAFPFPVQRTRSETPITYYPAAKLDRQTQKQCKDSSFPTGKLEIS